MAKLSRTKGHNHERAVAAAYRARWPHLTVRRSQQADKAYEPDVVVEGVPLWTECCVGAKPDPLAKLAQAERDVSRFTETMLPVVVWRRSGTQTTYATMRHDTLLRTTCLYINESNVPNDPDDLVVTVDFDAWLAAVDLPETRVKEAA